MMRDEKQLMDDFLKCTAWIGEDGEATSECPAAYKEIINSQKVQFEKDGSVFKEEGFILSGLWNGNLKNAPLLVLSSNPAIRTKECRPRYFPEEKKFYQPCEGRAKGIEIGYGESARDYLMDFSDKIFAEHSIINENSRALNMPWYDNDKRCACVPFWGCLRNAVDALLPDELRMKKYDEDYVRFLMSFALSAEIVPFQSNDEEGVDKAICSSWDSYTKDLISLSNASIVILIGKKVLKHFTNNIFGENSKNSENAMDKLKNASYIEHVCDAGKKRIVIYRPFNRGCFTPLIKPRNARHSNYFNDVTLAVLKEVFRKSQMVENCLGS